MTPEEQVKCFMETLGAISEACKALYDRLVNQGFTEGQALYLTGDYLKSITGANK